jgi:hypothetical protein
MADIAIVPPGTQLVTVAVAVPINSQCVLDEKPLVPPSGTIAGGGPTTGQIFPRGNN